MESNWVSFYRIGFFQRNNIISDNYDCILRLLLVSIWWAAHALLVSFGVTSIILRLYVASYVALYASNILLTNFNRSDFQRLGFSFWKKRKPPKMCFSGQCSLNIFVNSSSHALKSLLKTIHPALTPDGKCLTKL